MWLSRMMSKSDTQKRAERGKVTMSTPSGIETDGSVNSRSIKSYSPYGYFADVPVGEEVILIPSSDGEIAIGASEKSADLESGEIKIASRGGAMIELKNDGSIVFNRSIMITRDGEVVYGE